MVKTACCTVSNRNAFLNKVYKHFPSATPNLGSTPNCCRTQNIFQKSFRPTTWARAGKKQNETVPNNKRWRWIPVLFVVLGTMPTLHKAP
jgi:hypothetical protein